LDIECFGTEFSEVNEQFEVTSSVKNGEIILEMELNIECFPTECC